MQKIYSKITTMAKVQSVTESKIRALCLVFFLVTIGVSLSAQTVSWTGNTDTDWDTATNWSTGSVPTASSDVQIPTATNNPVISANALARSFIIHDGGELTINNGASLTIEVTTSPFFTFQNRGICTNNGTINMGVSSNAGQYYVLWNGRGNATQTQNVTPTFTNSATGVINIDNGGSSSWGIANAYGANFSNHGQIHIGQNTGVAQIGIGNTGVNSIFTNHSTGEIHIYKCQTGISSTNSLPTFINEGLIDIGAPGSTLFGGITAEGDFDNTATGTINIDYCSDRGLRINTTAGSTFDNDGVINIGQEASVGHTGIISYQPFTNNGTINLDRFTNNGVQQISGGPFQNNGLVNLGSTDSPNSIITGNANQFSNNTNGEIKGSGSISGGHITNNGGELSPGNSPGTFAFTSSQNFGNSTINLEINGTGTAGVDYDQITVASTATLTTNTVLNVTTGYTPTSGDAVVILDAGILSGTFAASSNLDGWTIAYDTPNAGEITLSQPAATLPDITCPANINVNNDAGVCSANVSFAATETVGEPASTITYSQDPGTDFPVGVTTVTATATNSAGSDICSFTVTVNDSEDPVFSDCPADMSVDTDAGECDAIVSYTEPTVSDNCSGAGVDAGNQTFSYTGAVQQFVVPVGVTSLSINATGAGGGDGGHPVNGQVAGRGGSATGTLAVTPGETLYIYVGGKGVDGNTTTGGGGLGGFNGGGTGGTAAWQPGAAGGGGGASDVRQAGTDLANRVIVAGGGGGAVDRGNGGNADQAGTDWIGNAPGESSGPAGIHGGAGTQSTGGAGGIGHPAGEGDGTAGLLGTGGNGPNAARPGGGGGGGYYGGGGGGARSAGNIVTGGGGGGSSYIGGVTGGSTSGSSNSGDGSIVISWDAVVATLTVTQTGLASGSSFPTGVTTVEWEATDAAGNSSTCSFNVTVSDNEAPTIACGGDITQDAGANCDAVVTWTAPAVTENCTGETVESTHDSGDTFPLGTTEVGYTVTDAAGNVGTCTFNVIIEDNTAPTITCPADQALTVDANCEASMIDLVAMATTSDNCAGDVTLTQDVAAGSTYAGGTVTLTATDAANNSATCTVEITVEDTTAPNLVCPANVEVTANAGSCAQLGVLLTPTPTDNCDSDVELTVASTTATLFSFSNVHLALFNVGEHEVNYTATDDAGNEATCTAMVTVNDVVAPTIVGCPTAPITADAPADECGENVQFGLIYPNDDCTNSTLTSTHISGDYFEVGTTEVVFTATDESGNESICAFDIVVSDVTVPMVECQDAAVMLDANGAVSTTVADLVTSVMDNCPITLADVSLDISNFTCANVGTPVTVTATATDGSGNTGTCTSEITVTDEIAPSAVCQDLTVSLDANGAASVAAADIDNGSDDNCPDFTLAITDGMTAYTCADAGMTHTLTLTVTDASNQTATCTSVVSVVDDIDPTITCPSDIAANTDPGVCTAAVTYSVTGDDNCTYDITQGEGLASGADFPLGSTDNAYTITDASGNTATCTFSVTISDNELPVIADCPANIVQSNDAGACNAAVAWTEPTASDNCTVTMTSTHASGDVFAIGTATVTYTAEDGSGNMATCSFDVTVNDDEDPVIVCPDDIVQGTDAGSCDAVVNYAAPVGTDNCPDSVTELVAGPASGSTFPIGSTDVTYSVTDAAGNAVSCTFSVTIEDTEAPVITGCPTDITQANDTGVCEAAITWTAPSATDNCSMTMTNSHDSGDVFAVGTTTVTYTATDDAGNETVCSFDVTVEDTELPVIACPADVAQGNDAGECGAAVTWADPVSSDNCPDAVLESTHASGDVFPVGTTEVGYTITDAAGNVATCAFNVVISDTEAPVISGCPTDIAQDNDLDACDAVITWTAPTATDNCSQTLTSTHNSGDTFPVGTTTVTYTSVDEAGNNAVCSFDVVVTDAQDPAITCVDDIVQGTDAGSCDAVVTYNAPVGTDNCPGAVTELVAGLASGSTFPIGSTDVTYSVTDAAGNAVSCTFSVTIEDNEAPVITGCPTDITQDNDAGVCEAAVSWTAPSATDNCSMTMTSSHGSGDVFAVGTTTVMYTATDDAGNEATCSFDVTVNDTEAPVITCPGDITQNTDAKMCDAVVTWADPVSSDNCPDATVESTHASGDTFPLGTTEVGYTITDAAGNVTTCTFNVVIEDNEAPDTQCQDVTLILDENGMASLTAEEVDNGSTDACGVESIAIDINAFDCDDAGDNTVTLTVTDVNGNAATCTSNVTVVDDEDPVITDCPTDITGIALPTGCSGSATWTIPTVTDNCSVSTAVDSEGVLIITAGETAFGTFPGGTTVITYTATDASGNETVCTFNVTVEDDIDPVITGCPEDMNLDTEANSCEAQAFWLPPTASDNCPGTTIIASHNPGDVFPTGSTTVGYTVTDAAGNIASCDFVINVSDNEKPQLTCPLDDVMAAGDGNCGYTIPDLSAMVSATDNCTASPVITQTPAIGDVVTAATFITYVATDDVGNATACQVDITVPDEMAASITAVFASCPDSADGEVSVVVTGGTEPYSYSWTGSTATTATITGVTAGNYTVDVTDANGCTLTEMIEVTGTDTTNPVADCENITVALDENGMATINPAQLSDDSSDDCSIASITASQTEFDCDDTGTNSVTVTVTDGSGNSDQCTAIVTVEDTDISTPAFCGQTFTIQLDGTGNASVGADDFGTVQDNCGLATASVLGDSSFDCTDLGITSTVTVIIFDGNGNFTTCDVLVDVEDALAPVADCEDLEVSLDDDGNASITAEQIGGNSTDNCSGVTLSLDITDFTCVNIGENTVTLTATDAANNSATCTATIDVIDDSVPTPDFCGMQVNLELDATGSVAISADLLGGISDNCGTAQAFFFGGSTIFNCTDIGLVNNVSVLVIDNLNNTAFCTMAVTVSDPIPATAVCQDFTLSLGDDGTATLLPEDIDGGSTDNCASLVMSVDLTDFSCADIGDHTVTLTVGDDAGNATSTCTATVSVVDDSIPEPEFCGASITVDLDANGTAILDASAFGTVQDNCGNAVGVFLVGNTTYGCSDMDMTTNVTVILTEGGNFTTCIVNVEVEDPLNACAPIPFISQPGGGIAETAEEHTKLEDNTLDENNGEVRLTSVSTAPNPFGYQTKISYQTNVPAHVRVSVVDARGQLVTVLSDSVKSSGTHSTFWRPEANVARGLYFILLETEGNEPKFVKVHYAQ